MTSATRSSSVAPFGSATVPSQSGAPLSRLTAISLPPGKPTKTYFSTTSGAAVTRSDSGVLGRW
ncbi:MAG: hypothetical protein AW07_04420 [Candidatus Accumulibacter sp. SK-11]|nr:MAG: hypothetical protein AW07_04420 [Candidatus Accumulibacter sp. SK-11]